MIPEFDHTAAYIWAAYALTGAVLGGLTLYALARGRAARARLDALQRDADDGQ